MTSWDCLIGLIEVRWIVLDLDESGKVVYLNYTKLLISLVFLIAGLEVY